MITVEFTKEELQRLLKLIRAGQRESMCMGGGRDFAAEIIDDRLMKKLESAA